MDLAQSALKFLEVAEKFEATRNWDKALENYEKAVEDLKHSGYLTERLSDLYSRIADIKNLINQRKKIQHSQATEQIEQLQEQAFAILDGAKKLESEGFLDDSVKQYMSAISILVQAGWSEAQLETIKSQVIAVAEEADRQRIFKRQAKQTLQNIESSASIEIEKLDQEVPAQQVIDYKIEAVKAFEEKKEHEDKIQSKAFNLIDEAKNLEKENKFDEAIKKYQESVKLLNSIGWTEQTQNIQVIIANLKRKKEDFEKYKVEKETPIEELIVVRAPITSASTEIGGVKLIEFEEKKRKEEEIQTKAFNIIDLGKKLERERKFDEAIGKFDEAIELLKSIEWDSHVQPIINFKNNIKEKLVKEEQAIKIREKRQEELEKLQETIYIKQKAQFEESAQEIAQKRQEFLEKRHKEEKKEKEFFALLDKADNLLLKEEDYDAAIVEYQNALIMITDIGPGWNSQIDVLKSTISNIQELNKSKKERKKAEEKKLLKKRQQEIEFQEQIAAQLEKERERLKKKEIALEARKDELQYREQKKAKAFEFLDVAQESLKQGELEKAIYSYQNAGRIFAEIQWSDELPLIENSIKELERKIKEQKELKQKQIQKEIERNRQEKEFQNQITKQLQLERDKIKARDIKLREREKELEYQEKRKNDAFKLFEEAELHIKEGNFDEAIEIYRKTLNIFAEIHWHDEINLIQSSIIELERRKQADMLQTQKRMEATLERDRQEREFQAQLANQMKAHRDKLQKREIVYREREKEIEYREKRKEEAFRLLDKAQEFLSQGKLDGSLDIYRNVANTFAQIQWIDEIPLIQEAIKAIEEKKMEKEKWLQKSLEKEMQQEAAHRAFIEQLKHQREIENARMETERALLAKKEEYAAQDMLKQEEALKLVEQGDVLLNNIDFIGAIENYEQAISILTQAGWSGGYLKLLHETLETIQIKKHEYEQEKQKDHELNKRRNEEDLLFQLKISEQMLKEQEKVKVKKIELEKKEILQAQMEERKTVAFKLMDEAESFLNHGEYEKSIETYRRAELILSEIQFPLDPIREMIQKVQIKKKNEELREQKDFERTLKEKHEESLFQQEITKKMEIEKQKMRARQKELKKREELLAYMEKRKENAFKILEEAEVFVKKSFYDKAIEYYQSAMLILSEIQFPTESINEMIQKVQKMKYEQQAAREKELQARINNERDERDYQLQIAENVKREKERLKLKQIQVEKMEQLKASLEKKKETAFSILDEAENLVKSFEYDLALERYRKAELLLQELQFPTDSIKGMITKVTNLKKQKDLQEEYELQKELNKIAEEREIQAILDERQKQEREEKAARQLAIAERERLIEQQASQRDVAYSLLDEAGKYLKRQIPDYDSAISLYVQARKILTENVGWEPEINNLTDLINELQQEKAEQIEKKKLEEIARLQRQQEYEDFQKEIRKRQEMFEQQKEEQQKQYQGLIEQRKIDEQLKNEGLTLIDQGKKLRAHHDFEKAYNFFEQAIEKFRIIGWNEEIQYIKTEIKNTKILEEKERVEEFRIQEIERELEKQRESKKQQIMEETQKKKQAVGEITNISQNISEMITERKKQNLLAEEREKERIEREAKEFGKSMSNLLRLKQDLLAVTLDSQEIEREKAEEAERAKDQEEIDDLARMIKEAAKKSKK